MPETIYERGWEQNTFRDHAVDTSVGGEDNSCIEQLVRRCLMGPVSSADPPEQEHGFR